MGKRILIVGPRMDIGGTERHLASILPEMVKMGFDIHAHLLERGGALEGRLIEGGVNVMGGEPGLSRPNRAIKTLLALSRTVRRMKPDIVHSFLPEPSILSACASAIAGHKTMIVSRRSLNRYRNAYPIFGRLDRCVCKRSTVLIGNSTAVAAELYDDCKDWRKIGVIFNGVSIPPLQSVLRRSEVRSRIGVSEECYLIIVVANLFFYKGHLDLIRALIIAKDSLPLNWRVVLIGRDQGQGKAIDEEARCGGISGNLLRLGERSDADCLLGCADLAILPSHEEGFSNSLIEGMAAGVPSIATAIGGNIDAIENGVSGVLVPVADPGELALAVIEVANNKTYSDKLAAGARARVSRMFTQEIMLNRYKNLYNGTTRVGEQSVEEILVSSDRN